MRPFLLVVTGLLVASAGFVGYFVAEPPPLPVVEIAAARFALHEARMAPPLAPAELARADTLSMDLERLFAHERGKLVRFRRSVELAVAARTLEDAANLARQTSEDSLARGLAAARQRREDLALRLDVLTQAARRLPGERQLRRVRQEAQVALDHVRVLEKTGELALLPDAIDTAAAALARAESSLDSRLARFHDPKLRVAWQQWVDQTVAETKGGRMAVLVEKLRRRCVVIQNRRIVADYRAEFGRNGLSDKFYTGDGATPEGRYRVVSKNDTSRYHKALLLDYPNAGDVAKHRAARARGLVPRGRGPGSLIEIHGNGGRDLDWTEGCVALRNDDMDELFRRVPVGTPITIVGSARLPGD